MRHATGMSFAGRVHLAFLVFSATAFAQTTVTYVDGQASNTDRVTTVANPLTVALASGNATEAGTITGNGSVTKTGAGTLTLSSAASSFGGGVTVSAGTLRTNSANVTMDGGPMHIASGATLDFGQEGLRLDKTSGNGTVTSEGADDMYFVGGATPFTSFLRFSGDSSVHVLSGQLTLARDNSWDGSLIADSGSILLTNGTALVASQFYIGADPSNATLTVERGATLQTTQNGSNFVLGNLTVTDIGSRITSRGEIQFGEGSHAYLQATAGAQIAADSIKFGSYFAGQATALISGAGSRVAAQDRIDIGVGDQVEVTVAASGTLAANNAIYLYTQGTLNLGAAAGAVAGAGGALDTPLISGDGTLQLNVSSSAGAPYYLTRNGTASGVPIDLQHQVRLVHTAGYTLSTGNLSGGGVTVTSGTFQLGADGATNATLAGNSVIHGELRLAGNTTVSGSLSGTGNITISAGAEARVNEARFESPLTLQGTLISGWPDSGLESRVAGITGPGAVIVDSGSTLILTGNAAHTGGTTTRNGTLQIGDGGTSGAINSAITNESSVAFSRSDEVTHTGAISGPGSLIQRGPGNLTLAGNYSYTGETQVLAGNLTLSPGAVFPAASVVFVESGTRFDAGNRPSGLTVGGLSGSGDFVLNGGGNLAVATNTDTTFSGSLSGNFHLHKQGSGTLTLAGTNTYSGGTTVAAGTLQIGGGSLAGPITGNILNYGTVTLFPGGTVALQSTISGPGGVRVLSGTLTIDQPQTYTGPTTLVGGQIVLGPNGSLASDLSFDPAFGGSVDLSATSANIRLTNPTGAAFVVLGTGTFTVNQTNDTQALLAINGAGTFRKEGTGTLITNGTLYTTNIVIAAGTLQIGNGGSPGRLDGQIENQGALVLNSTVANTISGAISGSGSVTQRGPATLTLSGNNSYSGGTLIASGTLQALGANSLGTGNVTIAPGATFSTNVGSLLLRVTPGSGGTVSILNALTFSSNSTFTLPVPLGGTGSLTISGGATFRTPTPLTHTGGTTIAANSTLEIGTGGNTGSLIGAVANQGTLTFNRADAVTFNGPISGSGTLHQAGAGTLTLTAASSYTGNTTISAGTLALASSASIASSARITIGSGARLDTSALAGGLTLASGQRLTGTGTVAGRLTAGSGSTIAPGNSPGTLIFADGLALANGSILDLELGTTSDLLRVTGGTLTGSASAGGIRLNLTNAGGFGAGTYTLIDFTGATPSSFDLSDFTFGTTITGYTYSLALVGSTLQLTATPVTPPVITSQPASTAVAVGGSAAFSVIATGNPAPTYQWRRNGSALAGASSADLVIPSVAVGNLGSYTVVATNSAGSITSQAATLRFIQNITFPTATGLTYPRSTPVALSATASSGLTVTYAVVSGPGTLSGNQLTLTAAGTVVVRATQAGDSTYAPATADQSFTATLDGFASWQSTYFNATQLANSAISGELADPDQDGLVNLAEYALGLDPLTSDAQVRAPAVSWDGTNWTFTWIRPTDRADVTYVAETSTDLVTWSSSGLTPALVARASGFDTWRVSVPAGTARRQFFRLVFTR